MLVNKKVIKHKCSGKRYWTQDEFVREASNIHEGKYSYDEVVFGGVDQKVKIGDRELSCVLVQVTVDAVGGTRTVRREWRCEEIPGGVARRESRQYLNGKELDSSLSQMEVVRFRAKR